jgi:gliding motility-associated-like protein
VFLPNAFTPNFDGKNDLFKVTVHGRIVKYYIAVFNRFGEMVFTSKDPLRSWDGFYKGRPAETGNYVWTCVYQLDGESQVDKKGQILLIR